MQRSFSNVKQKPAIKDCYSIGEILSKYKIAESTLRRIVSTNKIPKYNEGKFVYIPKYAIDPFLKRFIV
ncbi:helix-turn-helix domain-containing protein [Chryseobacterium cheonjiense]|uniref:Helix-turn-helix domain-containing protein n=1 Tax=Chryseobacterium cheonjiense TaxID=2728845 RepID=A0A7Y0A557_9FLAO|nr:helix-turn-helix domain-containing protein [Chryseobacterium cheonjiense]NML56761.1 helix-turn-helix domain-containing protein [Chryseobacterium cheonjiense]